MELRLLLLHHIPDLLKINHEHPQGVRVVVGLLVHLKIQDDQVFQVDLVDHPRVNHLSVRGRILQDAIHRGHPRELLQYLDIRLEKR